MTKKKVPPNKLKSDVKVATANIIRSPSVKKAISDIAYDLVDALNKYEDDFPPNNNGPAYEGLRTDYWRLHNGGLENFRANQHKTQFTIVLDNTQPDHHYAVPYLKTIRKESKYGEYNPITRKTTVVIGKQRKIMSGTIGNLSRIRMDISDGIVEPKKKGGVIVFWNKKGQIVFCSSRKNSWRGHEQYKESIEGIISRYFEAPISGSVHHRTQKQTRIGMNRAAKGFNWNK